ncbi:hypothetical protein ACA910_011615 [Epithemia clementina (nom. ined.)]
MTIVITNPYAKKSKPPMALPKVTLRMRTTTTTNNKKSMREEETGAETESSTTDDNHHNLLVKNHNSSSSASSTIAMEPREARPRRISPLHSLKEEKQQEEEEQQQEQHQQQSMAFSGQQSPRGKIFKKRKDEEQEEEYNNTSNKTLVSVASSASSSDPNTTQPKHESTWKDKDKATTTRTTTIATSSAASIKSAVAPPKGIFKRKGQGSGGSKKEVNGKTEKRGVTFEPHTTKAPSSNTNTTNNLSNEKSNNNKPASSITTTTNTTTTNASSRKQGNGGVSQHRSLFKSKLKSRYKQEIAALKKQRQKQQETKRLVQLQQKQQQQQQIQEAKQNKVLQLLEHTEDGASQDHHHHQETRIVVRVKDHEGERQAHPSQQQQHHHYGLEPEERSPSTSESMHNRRPDDTNIPKTSSSKKRKAPPLPSHSEEETCFPLHPQERVGDTIHYCRSWEEGARTTSYSSSLASPFIRRRLASRGEEDEEGEESRFRSPPLKTIVSTSPTQEQQSQEPQQDNDHHKNNKSSKLVSCRSCSFQEDETKEDAETRSLESSPSPSPPIVLQKSWSQDWSHASSHQQHHHQQHHHQQHHQSHAAGYPPMSPSCYPHTTTILPRRSWTSPSSQHQPHAQPVSPHPAAAPYWGPPAASPRMPPQQSTPYGYDGYYYPAHPPGATPHHAAHMMMLSPSSSFGAPGGASGFHHNPHHPSPYYSPAPPPPPPHASMRLMYPAGAAATFPGPHRSHGGYHPDRATYPPHAPAALMAATSMDDEDSVVDLGYNNNRGGGGGPSGSHHPQYMARMEHAYGNNHGGLGLPSIMPGGPAPPNAAYAPPGSFGHAAAVPQQAYWRPAPTWAAPSYRHPPPAPQQQIHRSGSFRSSPTSSPRYQYFSEDSEKLARQPQHRHSSKRLPPPLPVFQTTAAESQPPALQHQHPKDSSRRHSQHPKDHPHTISNSANNGGVSSNGSVSSQATKKSSGSNPGPVHAIVKVMANVLEAPCPLAHEYQKLKTAIGLLKPRRSDKEGSTTSFGISIQVHVTSTLVDPTASSTSSVTADEESSELQDKPSLPGAQEDSRTEQPVTATNDDSKDDNKGEAQVKIVATEGGLASSDADQPLVRRRRRRRRVFFAALTILNASIQNERLQEHQAKNKGDDDTTPLVLLEPGDIILSIAGTPTAGLNFAECCKLFHQQSTKKDCDKKDDEDEKADDDKDAAEDKEDENICVPIEIARRRKPSSSPAPQPSPLESSTKQQQQLVSTKAPKVTIAECHLTALARLIVENLLEISDSTDNNQRVLGRADNMETLLRPKLALAIPEIGNTESSVTELMTIWFKHCKSRLRRAHQRALQHWKQVWEEEEPNAIQEGHQYPLSDRQRSILRFTPRPSKGCRCSAKDHVYVNHANCPLYSNLRRLEEKLNAEKEMKDDEEAMDGKKDDDDDKTKKSHNTKSKDKDPLPALTTVESAMVDRVKRQREEQNAENEEARFVARMEQLQLETCKQAILAPSLTSMIISAVSDLSSQEEKATSQKDADAMVQTEDSPPPVKEESNDVEDEEDDDLPLSELAKKKQTERPSKKQKRAGQLSLQYVARLARHISWTWGHIAQEPVHFDHAWRWEVYHGQHNHNSGNTSSTTASNSPSSKSSSWDGKEAHNPRRPGSFTWEHVRWLFDETTVMEPLRELESHKSSSLEDLTEMQQFALQCFAQIVDPRQRGTGLMEEVAALVHTQVLEINQDDGSLRLAPDWYLNVDVLVLEQMDGAWGKDPLRYRMNADVVATLRREWIKVNALSSGGSKSRKDDQGEYGEEEEEEGQVSEAAWASRWAPEEPIYELDEFVTWRQAFEQREETQSNELHGIGHFGV